MKNQVAPFRSSLSQKRSRSFGSSARKKGVRIINCQFCQNTFSAVPREAICMKCKRPANRPLSLKNALMCLILFPLGFIKAVILRASQPYAALQALLCSISGGALWSAIYLLAK